MYAFGKIVHTQFCGFTKRLLVKSTKMESMVTTMGLMRRKPYPTDLTNEQWEILKSLLPGAARRGTPRRVDLREILNALMYLNRSGCHTPPSGVSPKGTFGVAHAAA